MKVPIPRKLPSGTWFIQLRLGGESIPVSARTKKDCIDQARLIKAEYLAGKREKKTKAPKAPTLEEAIDAYIARRKAALSPSTIRGYTTIKRTRFLSLMGKEITKISQDDWQAACNDELRNKHLSAKTLKNAWFFISSVILETTGNPAPKVKLPQVVPPERPFLEPEQIKPFIAAVHGTNVEIPALLALSSLRLSEIAALQWENVDLDKKLIKVRGAAVIDINNQFVRKKENKNATSTRIVPIMIGELYEALKAEKKEIGPIIDYWPNLIYKRINNICEKNGLPLVGVHGLRHSFVSLAYHLNVPEKIVMEIGGWADYQTMRRIYTHIARSDVARYTEYFEDYFSNGAEPTGA